MSSLNMNNNTQQHRLFLLLFLWTCICFYLFKLHNTKFSTSSQPSTLELITSSINEDDGSHYSSQASIQSHSEKHALQAEAQAQVSSLTSTPTPTSTSTSKSEQQQHQSTQIHSPANANSISEQSEKRLMIRQLLELPSQRNHSQCNYQYPSLLDLQFNNIHWQRFQTSKNPNDTRRERPELAAKEANFYLYNAYYDDRWRGKQASVRILAMIDRNDPPETNCLLWSKHLIDPKKRTSSGNQMIPLVTQAQFVYAWYPKWGNHHDGMLQPWIVTCPVPSHSPDALLHDRDAFRFVPDSVSLVEAPPELPAQLDSGPSDADLAAEELDNLSQPPLQAAASNPDRVKRQDQPSNISTQVSSSSQASIAIPPAASSSSSASPPAPNRSADINTARPRRKRLDCKRAKLMQISNNLPVSNERPDVKQKFAVCVKGLDFPHDDLSVRLVEWIELLNLLGASKIFLYNLNVHENITRVLHYYKQRGMIELIPLTLPGDQPNLPDYQHAYLKSRLTTKRQNELIPYNDCLYRNLYSYKYLALLDIDEIIMPLKHHTWHGLMDEVERVSLSEQNYSRASYNTRNVYFFDDLVGGQQSQAIKTPNENDEPTDRADHSNANPNWINGIPPYLHMMQHVFRSKNYTKPGQYVKCFHNTERVVSLHNHFPMNCFGQCTTYSIPTDLAHLQHYRRDCVGPLKQSCKNDYRLYTTRDTTIWKYRQQMIKRATRVLSHLKLLDFGKSH